MCTIQVRRCVCVQYRSGGVYVYNTGQVVCMCTILVRWCVCVQYRSGGVYVYNTGQVVYLNGSDKSQGTQLGTIAVNISVHII